MIHARSRKEADAESKLELEVYMTKRVVDEMVEGKVANKGRTDFHLTGNWDNKFETALKEIEEPGIPPGSIKLSKIMTRINGNPSKISDFFSARCQCVNTGCPAFYLFKMRDDYRKKGDQSTILKFSGTRFNEHHHDTAKRQRIREEDREELVNTVGDKKNVTQFFTIYYDNYFILSVLI